MNILRKLMALAALWVACEAVAADPAALTTVTTLEDGESLGGGKVTLRDAIRAMADPDLFPSNVTRQITFACADGELKVKSPIVVDAGVKAFEIDGSNGGKGLVIGPAESGSGVVNCVLFQLSSSVTFRNMRFNGAHSEAPEGGAIHAEAPVTFSNCAFTDNFSTLKGGSVYATAESTFVDCSFDLTGIAVEAESVGGAVWAGGEAAFTNCVFLECFARTGAAVHAATNVVFSGCSFTANGASELTTVWTEAGEATLAGCVFWGNGVDLGNKASLRLLGVTYDGAVQGTAPVETQALTTVTHDDNLFVNGAAAIECRRGSVTHKLCLPLYAPQIRAEVPTNVVLCATDLLGETGEANVRGALRHTFYTTLRFNPEKGAVDGPVEAYAVAGSAPKTVAPARLPGLSFLGWYSGSGSSEKQYFDASGNPVVGAYPKAAEIEFHPKWKMSVESLTVNTAEDGDNPLSTVTTFRNVVTALEAYPSMTAEDGSRTIRFACADMVLLTNELVTTQPMTIDGFNGGRGVTLKTTGGGRFLKVNGALSVANMTFLQGTDYTTEGGGAIFATAPVVASNCVFSGCASHGCGGALNLRQGGTFLGCTFKENTTLGDSETGGAVAAAGNVLFANCSFVGNYANDFPAVDSSGTLGCFDCTFTDNHGDAAVLKMVGGNNAVVNSLFVANDAQEAYQATGSVTADGCVQVARAEDAFAYLGKLQTRQVGAVSHVVALPLCAPSMTGVSEPVWHDAAWENVSWCADKSKVFRGTPSAATLELTVDLLNAPESVNGAAGSVRGVGAVRSEYYARVTFEATAGHYSGITNDYAVCGAVLSANEDVPVWSGRLFAGWFDQPSLAGTKYLDGQGAPTAATVPYQALLALYTGWQPTEALAIVTTLEDGQDRLDGKVTLRDAVQAMADNPDFTRADGTRTITFDIASSGRATLALDAPLVVPAGTVPFTIDGHNAGAGLQLAASAALADRLISHAGEGLTLANLMFPGRATTNVVGSVVAATGALTVTNCAFFAHSLQGGDLPAGALVATVSAQARFVGCSFVDNDLGASPAISGVDNSTIELTSCSLLSREGAAPALAVDATSQAICLSCTLDGVYADPIQMVNSLSIQDAVFAPGLCTQEVYAVSQVYRRALYCAAVTSDVDESRLPACDQTGRAAVRPGKGAVTSEYAVRYDFDPDGGTVSPESVYFVCGEVPTAAPCAMRTNFDFGGWYAEKEGAGDCHFDATGAPQDIAAPFAESLVLYAKWAATAKLLKVTSAGDETEPDKVTLREAVDALSKYSFVDPRITFDGVAEVRLKSPLKIAAGAQPIEIDGTGGTVLRPADGVSTRLIEHEGESLVLRNLTLSGGSAADGEGGAVCARAAFAAENCAFLGHSGSAVSVSGARAGLIDCSFADNTNSSEGGAVRVASGAELIVAGCTFLRNKSTVGGGAVFAAGGLTVVASTFYANDGASAGGGVKVDASGSAVFCSTALANAGDGAARDVSGAATYLRTVVTQRPSGASIGDEFVVPVEKIFKNPSKTLHRTRAGVAHEYCPPASAAPMDKGVWIWHDETWLNVAWSEQPLSSGRTALVGTAALATVIKERDGVGTQIALTIIGAVTAEEGSLVVTTCDDVVDPSDGLTSLREAFDAASHGLGEKDADGRFSITFDSSIYTNGVAVVELKTPLDALASHVVVRGPTDDRRLRLAVSDADAPAAATAILSCPATTSLEFRDLEVSYCTTGSAERAFLDAAGAAVFDGCAFRACNQANGRLLISSNNLKLLSCSFDDNWSESGKGGVLAKGGLAVVENCTFIGNRTGQDGVLSFSGGVRAFVVSSTFVGNRGAKGALCLSDDQKNVFIVNTVLVGNEDASGANEMTAGGSGYCSLIYSLYSRITSFSSIMTESAVSVTEADAFAAARESLGYRGTERSFRRLNRVFDANGRERGCFVYRDTDWDNVAYSLYDDTSKKVNLAGTNRLAKVRLSVDIVGREVKTVVVPGSYAVTHDAEQGEVGKIEINSALDPTTTPSEYDGVVTLREAIAFAESHPVFATPEGTCEVTFGDDFFASAQVGRILSKMRQIEVSGFTNRTLVVRAPGGDRSVILDGDGRFRAFYVAPQNRLLLQNLNFTNCVSSKQGALVQSTAGGAIHNAGTLWVSNCAFRACSTPLSGHAYGGALATFGGATSRVERCTFAGCSSGLGGAVYTADRGVAAMVMSTFSGCSALKSGSLYGRGGAVCDEGGNSRTLLVNVTITGCSAEAFGGGVCTGEKAAFVNNLYLLNSILVGNDAALDGADLHLGSDGRAKGAYVYCGKRTVATDSAFERTAVTEGCAPADVFAQVTTTGLAVPVAAPVAGVTHDLFALDKTKNYLARFVKADSTWSHVGYLASPTGSATLFLGQLAQVTRRGTLLAFDQVGETTLDLALPGSVFVRMDPEGPITPPEEKDPLLVDPADFETLTNVIARAAANPSLASNGCLTVSFASAATIEFDGEVVLPGAFAAVPLVIRGPVTFSGGGATRLFSLESGVNLRLEDVTFTNGLGEPNGGAIAARGAFVTAVNCTFSGNRAVDSEWGGYGGAICLENDDEGFESRGVFVACTFSGNEAVAAGDYVGLGHNIYHDDTNLELYDCTFDGAKEPGGSEAGGWSVEAMPRVRVEKTTGAFDYFDTVAVAVMDCQTGDKLVILDEENAPSPEDLAKTLPAGVTILGPYEYLWDLKTAVTADLKASGKLWYTARVSTLPSGALQLAVVLDEKVATPEVSAVDASSDSIMSVWPGNVKPLLEYGLGRGESPAGPFDVSAEAWVRADEKGELPRPLTAPKSGASGFYRVIVRE